MLIAVSNQYFLRVTRALIAVSNQVRIVFASFALCSFDAAVIANGARLYDIFTEFNKLGMGVLGRIRNPENKILVSTPNLQNLVPFLHSLVAIDNYYVPYKVGFRKPKLWGPGLFWGMYDPKLVSDLGPQGFGSKNPNVYDM